MFGLGMAWLEHSLSLLLCDRVEPERKPFSDVCVRLKQVCLFSCCLLTVSLYMCLALRTPKRDPTSFQSRFSSKHCSSFAACVVLLVWRVRVRFGTGVLVAMRLRFAIDNRDSHLS